MHAANSKPIRPRSAEPPCNGSRPGTTIEILSDSVAFTSGVEFIGGAPLTVQPDRCLPSNTLCGASQCVLLRNSTMKLIHPTAIVTMPIAMQRSDAVQIVPATIQTTPAKMIARETRLARTLSLITRYV